MSCSACRGKAPELPSPSKATSGQANSPSDQDVSENSANSTNSSPGLPRPSPPKHALTSPSHDDQVTADDLNLRPDDWFEDVTERTGVHFTHRNGREGNRFLMIESFGGGVACIDFDADGDIDLFFTGGGQISSQDPLKIEGLPSSLFRNEGEWRWSEATTPAGLQLPIDYSQGCAVADFDADGFPDLLVCCYGRNRLYHNQGDGSFIEAVDALPARDPFWSTTATFADLNHDGLPDLFIARYADWSPEKDIPCVTKGKRDLCGPSSYAGTTCLFYRNDGAGQFVDESEKAGVGGKVHGLAVVAADLNLDRLVDIYVASDTTPNQLYLGRREFPLSDTAPLAGVDVNEWGQAEGSMGVDVADYDGDLLPDLFVTNFELEDNALYQNRGDGHFLHSTVSAGLAGVSRMRVGFGTSLADFDHDGRPDLFVFNGNPIYELAETPFRQRSQLFRNTGSRFQEVSTQGGSLFRRYFSGRGNAAADLDNDGALDLIVVPMNDPVRIVRNRRAPGNYVRVGLRATSGELDAIGARVTAKFANRELARFVSRGTGFFSQPDPRILFPVDDFAEKIDVKVDWPGGDVEVFRGLATRRYHVLIQGHGERPQ
jgi:hypothetical protein